MTAQPDRRKTQPARRGAKTNFHHFRDTTPATRGAGLIFTSGYVAIDPETGGTDTESIESETRRTLDNLKLILEEAGSSLDKVPRVHIFMTDLGEWERMNVVYMEYFPTDPPTRRTAHAQLVPGFRIEIDCIALE